MQFGDDDDTQPGAAQAPANDAGSGSADENQEGQQQAQEGAADAGEGDGGEGEQGSNALQKAAQAAAEPPKKDPVKPFQARIGELTKNWREEERQRKAAEDRAARLEAELAEARRGAQAPADEGQQQQRQPTGVPEEMVDRLADQKAQAIAAQTQFNNDCNLTFMKGKAAHPDFEAALETFGALGGLDRAVVEDALATDAPHDVLYALGKDPDEAMRVLGLPRNKRIAEMTKMLMKAPPKPAVSKAAAPISPVNKTAKADFDFADDKADDRDWFAKRNQASRAAGRI